MKLDITDIEELEKQIILKNNLKYTKSECKILPGDILLSIGGEKIPFKELVLYATHNLSSSHCSEKIWVYKHIETKKLYELTAWYDGNNFDDLQTLPVDYTDDFMFNRLGYISTAIKEYKILNKTDLLIALTEINDNLEAVSGNALKDEDFLKWMKSTTVTEDEVNRKTWHYEHVITIRYQEILIDTTIKYDAFSYNGNDEEYYDLAQVKFNLNFSRNSDLCAYFFNLYYTSLGGRSYATSFDIMMYKLEKELGVFEANETIRNLINPHPWLWVIR